MIYIPRDLISPYDDFQWQTEVNRFYLNLYFIFKKHMQIKKEKTPAIRSPRRRRSLQNDVTQLERVGTLKDIELTVDKSVENLVQYRHFDM